MTKLKTFILGSGFSKPAGFPLGNELFQLIKDEVGSDDYKNILKPDIDNYLRYQQSFNNKVNNNKVKNIDFERFITFLDIKYLLQLNGSDTWSNFGNRSQVLIKNTLAKMFTNCLNKYNIKDTVYTEFALNLKPNDVVLTFNYDTLLEKALDETGKRYRLYPSRYKNMHSNGGGESGDSHDEIIILKLHGSIDWFDIIPYEKSYTSIKYYKNFSFKNTAFTSHSNELEKIVDEPYPSYSYLQNIYRMKKIDKYLKISGNSVSEAPLIISPSYQKIPYLNPLIDLWYGLNKYAIFNDVIIIGYSIPEYDEYIRVPILNMINNAISTSNNGIVKIIDKKDSKDEQEKYKRQFPKIKEGKLVYNFDGFNKKALEIIFNNAN